MNDPVTLGLASTAVSLVNGTISLFKQVNETARESDNIDLKRGLSDLYSQIVEIKAQVLDLVQENAELRAKLNQKASLTRDSRTGFYLREGDPDPLCPFCFERDQKLIHLDSPYSGTRFCKVCSRTFDT